MRRSGWWALLGAVWMAAAGCDESGGAAAPPPDAVDAGEDMNDDAEEDFDVGEVVYAGLVINEVAAAGEPTDWVELYNGSAAPIPLVGVRITDDPGAFVDAPAFEAGRVIAPGGFAVIYLASDDFPGFMLGSDEAVAVFAPDGTPLDAVDWAEGQSPAWSSWGRIPSGSGPFKLLQAPTPGEANVDNPGGAVCGDGRVEGGEACDDGALVSGDGCAPGCRLESGWVCEGAPSGCATVCGDAVQAGAEECDDFNTEGGDGCAADCRLERAVSPVVINELSAADADWVELKNTGAAPVDLAGWSFTDDAGAEHTFTFPAGALLASNGYLLIERDAPGGFTFGLGGADALRLYDAAGALVDLTTWQDGQAPAGASWGRSPDGVGPFQTLTPPTPTQPNP